MFTRQLYNSNQRTEKYWCLKYSDQKSDLPEKGKDLDEFEGIRSTLSALHTKNIKYYVYHADKAFYLDKPSDGSTPLFEKLLRVAESYDIKVIASLSEIHLLSSSNAYWIHKVRPECIGIEKWLDTDIINPLWVRCYQKWNIEFVKVCLMLI